MLPQVVDMADEKGYAPNAVSINVNPRSLANTVRRYRGVAQTVSAAIPQVMRRYPGMPAAAAAAATSAIGAKRMRDWAQADRGSLKNTALNRSYGSGHQTKAQRRQKQKRKQMTKYSAPSLSKRISRLGSKVKSLSNYVNTTRLIRKNRFFHQMSIGAANEIAYEESIFDKSDLNSYMGFVPFLDEATQAIIERALTSGAIDRNYKFSLSAKTFMKNGANTPIKVDCYLIVPKVDNNALPSTNLADGFQEVGIGTGTAADLKIPQTWPSMSGDFMQNWEIKQKGSFFLSPGQHASMHANIGNFTWNAARVDEHNDAHQKRLGCYAWLYRLDGAVVHDCTPVTSGTLGTTIGTLDILEKQYFKLKYDGGAKMTRYKLVSNAAAGITAANGVSWLSETAASIKYDKGECP